MINLGHGDLYRKPVIKFDTIDDRTMTYIQDTEKRNGFLTDALLIKKAENIAKSEKIDCFKSSSGWLWKFRKRHHLRLRNIVGEEMSAKRVDPEVITDFQTHMKEKIEKYGVENVYNADETGIFYKRMPTKTLCTQTRKGLKNFKDRVTVFLCANITGNDKLKPF